MNFGSPAEISAKWCNRQEFFYNMIHCGLHKSGCMECHSHHMCRIYCDIFVATSPALFSSNQIIILLDAGVFLNGSAVIKMTPALFMGWPGPSLACFWRGVGLKIGPINNSAELVLSGRKSETRANAARVYFSGQAQLNKHLRAWNASARPKSGPACCKVGRGLDVPRQAMNTPIWLCYSKK